MNVRIGEEASAGSTNDTAVVMSEFETTEKLDHYITVVSGTIKFGVGSVPSTATGFTSSMKVPPIRCKNGDLHIKQAASGDKFVISIA